MTITVNTKDYTFDSAPTPDSALYTGPGNTFAAKDLLLLKRAAPKPTSTNPGVARATVKFTRSVTISGVARDAIVTAEFSIPVGMSEADVDAIRDDLGDALLLASIDALVYKHDLTH